MSNKDNQNQKDQKVGQQKTEKTNEDAAKRGAEKGGKGTGTDTDKDSAE